MTKFTKEQLINQAREEVDFWHERDELIPSQQTAIRLRLSEIALAALMAPTEPAYQYRIRNAYNGQVTEWQTIRRDQVDFVLKAQPLNAEFQITAPPVPVVPEEATPGSIEILASIRPPHGVAYQWDEEQSHAAADAWNACRGAMFQGADGNSPVIPDGYALVPVDMAPEMMRAVQLNSELGGYAASNLSGAYSLFREFWDVAIAAAPQQEDPQIKK